MKEKHRQYYKMLGHTLDYRINESKAIIRQFLDKVKNPYVAFSGGKDSTVMLHMVSQIDNNIDVFTERNDMDFPDKMKLCDKIIDICNINNYYEGHTERINLLDGSGWFKVIKEFVISGNYDGCFLGLRAEESKGRRITIAKKGVIYNYAKSNYAKSRGLESVMTCLPMARWKAQEVFAYIIKNNLPYHKIYDCDDFKSPHEIRMSWIYIASIDEAKTCEIDESSIMIYKKYFPEIFEKLSLMYGNNKIRRYL
jgi:phosphoadenosine phosphosulfate reductase